MSVLLSDLCSGLTKQPPSPTLIVTPLVPSPLNSLDIVVFPAPEVVKFTKLNRQTNIDTQQTRRKPFVRNFGLCNTVFKETNEPTTQSHNRNKIGAFFQKSNTHTQPLLCPVKASPFKPCRAHVSPALTVHRILRKIVVPTYPTVTCTRPNHMSSP